MSRDVLDRLQSAKDARDCENKLVTLLDYDKFDVVKKFTRNRDIIFYCTKLNQAQTPAERQVIEQEMSEDPKLAQILKGN